MEVDRKRLGLCSEYKGCTGESSMCEVAKRNIGYHTIRPQQDSTVKEHRHC